MKCPYCDHDLSIKYTPQGPYGKCSFCRFSGYVPTGRTEHPSNEDTGRTEHPSNEDTGRTEHPLPLPCCAKYKTAGGVERHLERVYEERDIHPRVYKKHEKIFEILSRT